MEKLIPIVLLSFTTQFCFSQPEFTFNPGGVKPSEYYSSIPYENHYEMIIVRASINGKEYRFILDTGAPTAISTALFNELNPTIMFDMPIWDANQLVDSVSVALLEEITFGDITFTDIPVMIAEQTMILDCYQADGFIGSNLLSNSIIQFSDIHKAVTLTSDAKKLALNPKQSTELDLNDFSQPYLRIKLKNKWAAKELLLFDSGMAGFYDVSISRLTMHKFRIFEFLGSSSGSNSISYHGVGLDTLQYKLLLPVMEINGVQFKNISVKTTIADHSRIGNKLLDYGIVTIDYKNKKFYFEPFFEKEKDLSEKDFPFDFVPRENHLYIGFVWDTSLEDKIKVGDQVMAINGIDYENVTLCDLIAKKSEIRGLEKMTLILKDEKGLLTEITLEKE